MINLDSLSVLRQVIPNQASKQQVCKSLAKTLETYIEEYCKNIVGEVFLLEIYIFMLKYFYSTKSEHRIHRTEFVKRAMEQQQADVDFSNGRFK